MTRHHHVRFFAAAVLAVAVPVGTSLVRAQAQPPGATAVDVTPPDPNVPLYFEVASVKPNTGGQRGGNMRRQPGGRVTATNMPLRQLVIFAYQMTPLTVVGGPAWAATTTYDINATLGFDAPMLGPGNGPDHMMLAMRTLLADRFKLKVHHESREMDVYALTMAKPGAGPGPQLKPSTLDCSPARLREMAGRAGNGPPAPPDINQAPQCGGYITPGRFRLGGMPISMLVGPLGGFTGRTVVDRTGLTGLWDAEMTFAIDPGRGAPPPDAPPPDPNAPSIFTALQEQLGLKLEATKAPVDVLVIDNLEQPTPD